ANMLSSRSQAMIVRAGEPRALHDIQPDAAAPDHQDALARGHPRVTNHSADASGDAAADDRRMRERQILANPDRLLGRADDKLGKRPDPRHMVDWLAVKLHARRAVVHHPSRRIVVADAQDGAAR